MSGLDGLQGSGPGWGSQGGFRSRITKRHGPCTYLSQRGTQGLNTESPHVVGWSQEGAKR